MMVRTLSHQERFKTWKLNLTCPGYVATILNGFDGSAGGVESGAISAVRLATLGKDGTPGTTSNRYAPFGW